MTDAHGWAAMIVEVGGSLILLGIIGVAVFRLSTGAIPVRALLRAKPARHLSPVRIQLLVLTALGAAAYLSSILAEAAEENGRMAMPDPPEELLLLLGASHVLYLGGKTLAQPHSRLRALISLLQGGR